MTLYNNWDQAAARAATQLDGTPDGGSWKRNSFVNEVLEHISYELGGAFLGKIVSQFWSLSPLQLQCVCAVNDLRGGASLYRYEYTNYGTISRS